ncbi:MAG TPA: DNA polymerase III subunit delta, partial [Verrucomicrobiales bacterium]|nr:DNA polymerase III subunit delta [Verrucomicrobiales bacterium]
MPRSAAAPATSVAPVTLVCGDDEFSVKQRARQVWDEWCAGEGGLDHEIIDGTAGNVEEALRRLGQLREA